MDEVSNASQPAADPLAAERESAPRAPRWGKVSGIIAAVVVLVFLILLLAGGNHGPGRHLDGGDERPPTVEHSVPHP